MIEITALYASPSIDVNVAAAPVIELQAAELGGSAAARVAADLAKGYRDEAEAAALAADADATQAHADAVQVAADRLQTGQDVTTATAQAGIATTQAGLAAGYADAAHDDALATAADRVQTGLDVATATTQAGIATTQAGLAAGYAADAANAAATAGPVQSVAGKTGVVTLVKADVGLGNVDNTSDANKPVSSATASALAGKADSSHNHDAAYVNVGGDAMTGQLTITAATTPQVLTATGSYKEGPQLIPNSEFDDNSAWTLSGGWIIEGGKLKNPTGVAGDISVPISGLTPGASYVVEFGVDSDSVYFTLRAVGYGAQSYWRSWEEVKHTGYIADATNITLKFVDVYRTSAVQIDYIRMYKVVADSARVLRGTSVTAPTFDLVASGTSFGIGQDSLKYSANAVNSIAIGNGALKKAIRPYGAVAIGAGALGNSVSPKETIAIGWDTLKNQRDAMDNVAIGAWGCMTASPADQNTAIGTYSLTSWTGEGNSTLGYGVFQGLQSGKYNVGIGHIVAHVMTGNASNNTLVGAHILSDGSPTTPNQNMTGLGYNAFNKVPYDGSMCLGYNSAVTGANQNQIGNSNTTTYAYGAVQDRSDRRDKTDIRPTILGLDFIKALTPVDFRWDMRDDYRAEINPELTERSNNLRRELGLIESKDESEEKADTVASIRAELAQIDSEIELLVEGNKLKNVQRNRAKRRNRYHHGLIAQDVKKVMSALNVDFGGYQDHSINGGDDVLSIGYTELISPLIRAVQEQQEQIDNLITRLAKLEKK